MKDAATVLMEFDGPIALLQLNRPNALNALSDSMKAELAASIRACDARSEVRVIVISGIGRAFSSGADRNAFDAIDTATLLDIKSSLETGADMIEAILSARSIVLTCVHGYCIGGGVSIALASDLCIAAADATFFIPEVDLALPFLWGSTPLMAMTCGIKRANYYTLTAQRFTANDAKSMGLVNEIHPQSDLEARARALAESIAAKPGTGVHAHKAIMNGMLRRLMLPTNEETNIGIQCLAKAHPVIAEKLSASAT